MNRAKTATEPEAQEEAAEGQLTGPIRFGDSEYARQAGLQGGRLRRQRKEAEAAKLAALAAGPRETIAAVFHENPRELQGIIRSLRSKAAAGDLAASRELRAWLDQGLGRVEVGSGTVATQDTPLHMIPREERAQMIASLRAQLAQGDELGAQPSSPDGSAP